MSHRYAVAQARYAAATKRYQRAITHGTTSEMADAMDAQARAFAEMTAEAGQLVYGIRAAVRTQRGWCQ